MFLSGERMLEGLLGMGTNHVFVTPPGKQQQLTSVFLAIEIIEAREICHLLKSSET